MKVRVGIWGNSLAVRVPVSYAIELKLEGGSELEVTCVDGGLLLRQRKREYTLDELVQQIKPENIHGEMDWGSAVGGESW